MDINFANQLSVTLSQSIWLVIAAAVLGACVTGAVTIIRDIKRENSVKTQRRLQAYNQLMSMKFMLLHSYIMYYNTQMIAVSSTWRSELDAYYHRASGMDSFTVDAWRSRSPNFIIAREARSKSTEMELHLAKSDESFWKVISQIQILFSHMHELESRISLIQKNRMQLETYVLHFDELQGRLFDDYYTLPRELLRGNDDRSYIGVPPTLLEDWSLQMQTEISDILESDQESLQALIEALESKIDDLLDYLRPEVESSYRDVPEPRQQWEYQMRA